MTTSPYNPVKLDVGDKITGILLFAVSNCLVMKTAEYDRILYMPSEEWNGLCGTMGSWQDKEGHKVRIECMDTGQIRLKWDYGKVEHNII